MLNSSMEGKVKRYGRNFILPLYPVHSLRHRVCLTISLKKCNYITAFRCNFFLRPYNITLFPHIAIEFPSI